MPGTETGFLVSGGCRLYVNGVNVNPMTLYPPVELPVSSGTPMLSSLVRWDHSDSWRVPTADEFLSGSTNNSANTVEVDISSPEDAYLTGHVIDGRVSYPATGYLVQAWRQLARMKGQPYQETPVCFDDVHLHGATILPSSGKRYTDEIVTAKMIDNSIDLFSFSAQPSDDLCGPTVVLTDSSWSETVLIEHLDWRCTVAVTV